MDVKKCINLNTVCAYQKFTTVPIKYDEIWNGYTEETNAQFGIGKKALLFQAQSYCQQYGINTIYLLPVNLYALRQNFNHKGF